MDKLSWVPEGFCRAGWNIYESAQLRPKPRASKARVNREIHVYRKRQTSDSS